MKPYYQDANATLYCGDCRDLLPKLGEVDCVITDPPYGVRFCSHGMCFRGEVPISGDDSSALAEVVYRHCKAERIPLAMFYSPFRPFPIRWRSVLVWAKGEYVGIGGDRRTCWKRDVELIGVDFNRKLEGNRDSSVLRYKALSPPPSGHVAEKPTNLMSYLIRKLTRKGEIVVDPFTGSGTTGVACVQTGRKFIGVEIEEKWCEIAADRISRARYRKGLGIPS